MRLPLHVKVYYLAATYGVVDLEDMALRHLIDTLEESPDRVLSPWFREAATLACTSKSPSDQRMRQALTDALSNHAPSKKDQATRAFLTANPHLSPWPQDDEPQDQQKVKATSPPADEASHSRTTFTFRAAPDPQKSTPPPRSPNVARASPGRSEERSPGRRVLTPTSRRQICRVTLTSELPHSQEGN